MSLCAPQRLWSDDDRKQVAGLLIDGASAAEVAKIMSLTRNAAIGRICRDPELHPLMRRARQQTPVLHIPRPPRRMPPRPPKRAEPVLMAAEPVPDRLMPLVDTGSQWCKWPVMHDPEVKGGVWCCGAPVRFGDVYCQHHRTQARRL